MEDKWTIDKLDNSNWTTWKFQMRHLLMAKGLWKYIDGTETLAEDASPEARAKFTSESQKAISTIVMAISTTQLYLVHRIRYRSILNVIPRQTNCISRKNTSGKK